MCAQRVHTTDHFLNFAFWPLLQPAGEGHDSRSPSPITPPVTPPGSPKVCSSWSCVFVVTSAGLILACCHLTFTYHPFFQSAKALHMPAHHALSRGDDTDGEMDHHNLRIVSAMHTPQPTPVSSPMTKVCTECILVLRSCWCIACTMF